VPGEVVEDEAMARAFAEEIRMLPKTKIAQEVSFDPVLSVIKAKNFGGTLKIANDTIYLQDREVLEHARREFHVGNLYFNRKITGALVGVQLLGGFNL